MSELELAGCLVDGPADAGHTLVLAHGAGAGMDSEFMETVAAGVAAAGYRVVRFEFPYMQRRRADGGRRPPDRMPTLEDAFRGAVQVVRERFVSERLSIGGKSMGGRVATRVCDELAVDAVVVFGYPFHPPRKPERLRTAHLAELSTRTLVIQGERDRFGTPDEVAGYRLAPRIEVRWSRDGDHSLKPRTRSGRTHDEAMADAIAWTTAFLAGVGSRRGKDDDDD